VLHFRDTTCRIILSDRCPGEVYECKPSPDGTVEPSDCATLANAIFNTLSMCISLIEMHRLMVEATEGTFFVPARTYRTANFGSCEFAFVSDTNTETVEYCWDDFVSLPQICRLIVCLPPRRPLWGIILAQHVQRSRESAHILAHLHCLATSRRRELLHSSARPIPSNLTELSRVFFSNL